MILFPIAGHIAFRDHCGECGCETDWSVEQVKIDWKKEHISISLYCSSCRNDKTPNEWRRRIEAPLPVHVTAEK